jgi:sugar lactone lactonase YvrE
MTLSKNLLVFVLAGIELTACTGKKGTEDLYQSSVIMPVNSSTEGVEGPAVDGSGTLYWVNYSRQGTIGCLKPGGQPEIFVELPAGSIGNGIRFDSRGNMLIADYTNHNILRVNMTDKSVSVFAHSDAMAQPNDIAIDSRDRIYASDPDWKNDRGKVWKIDTDGTVTLLDSLGPANGIEVSPDEKSLYVNASGKVYVYDIAGDGNITNRRVLVEFHDHGMDGMRCDTGGNLYITRFGKGVVAKVSPEGKTLLEIQLTGKRPTNIAFGGKDGRTAFVTLQDQGNLESFRAEAPGREWEMLRKYDSK